MAGLEPPGRLCGFAQMSQERPSDWVLLARATAAAQDARLTVEQSEALIRETRDAVRLIETWAGPLIHTVSQSDSASRG